MRQDSLLTQLAHTKAAHNLLPPGGAGGNDDGDSSEIKPSSSLTGSDFKDETVNRRISARPINIISQSDQDILHFKEENFGLGKQGPDELLAIPVLPADEMDSLASEIKLWNTNVRCVRWIFLYGFLCSLALVIIAVAISWYWYLNPESLKGLTYINRTTTVYNAHMCIQLLSMFLVLTGSMLFRILPHTEMRKVIWMHAIILGVPFGACLVEMSFSIAEHEAFTEFETHYYSLHSWVGLLGLVLFGICFVTGWIFLYYPVGSLRARHAIYGKITFGLVGTACLLGYYERAIDYEKNRHKFDNMTDHWKDGLPPSVIGVNCVGLLLLSLSISMRVGLANYSFRRQMKPQWDVIVFRSIREIEEIFMDVHECYDSFELWVKMVNNTKMTVMHSANEEGHGNEDGDSYLSA